MTVRELIARARLSGFEHIAYVGSFGTEHTWTDPDFRVGIEFVDGIGARLTVHKRRRRLSVTWEEEIAKVVVSSADQVSGVLSALGVLPSPTGVAA